MGPFPLAVARPFPPAIGTVQDVVKKDSSGSQTET